MKRFISRFARSAFLSAFLLGLLLAGFAVAERKNASAAKAEDPFLNGPPFTYEQILKLVSQDAIPLHRRKEAILGRGIAFSLSDDQAEKLKAAGASDDILRAIKSKSKPVAIAPPPPPKKDPKGAIEATCAPVDCDVKLNGTSLGKTKDGRLEIADLRPGAWTVDFNADGYIASQSSITVTADKTVPLSIVLQPNRATLEAYGSEVLKKVVQAVSGEDGMDHLITVQATGSLTIWSKDGNSVRWTLLMRNNPDRALFQAKAGSMLREVAFVGSEFTASKNLKGQDALDLPTDFGFIRDYLLPAVIAKLSDPQFKKVAKHPAPVEDEEFPLVAENGTEKIAVSLDGDLRPQKVRISTSTGIGSALITYADYIKSEKASYPKTIQIKPDSWPHGIEVHFDNVDLNAKFSASDYKLRGKPLFNVGN